MNFSGCGLGLRRDFLFEDLAGVDFLEITPENWFYMPNKYRDRFDELMSSNKIIPHGLGLSIGSFEELDFKYLKELKSFLDRYNIETYSEHLSFSSLKGRESFELLPILMTKKSAEFISNKLNIARDYLNRDIILENPTYYFLLENEINELEFMDIIQRKTKVKFLLDVNNVYVNSKNHLFDAREFISFFDSTNVEYLHIAGHKEIDSVLIDTHSEPICDDVFELLDYTYKIVGQKPTLLERDSNIPKLDELKLEINRVRSIYETRN